MVQRFGRCNRAGEHANARIYWIDIDDEADEALPYEAEALAAARERLNELFAASPETLPGVAEPAERTQVLRRRDLLDLFNTDPDLSGFDVDVSPYIRDPGNAQSQVFWRDFDEHPVDDAAPGRDELCPAGLGQLNEYLGKKGREAWTWDPLAERWRSIGKQQLRPGLVLLLKAGDGGYLEDQGFVADAKQTVTPVQSDSGVAQERYSGDSWSMIGRYVTLTEHLQHVAGEAGRLAGQLGLENAERDILTEAGRWHDVGKAHEAFQRGIVDDKKPDRETLWAKSAQGGMPRYHVLDEDGKELSRKGFRHELASMLAWLEHGDKNEHADLIAYLIAAHHGKVRMGLRALPTENEPPGQETLYARGVWHGDRLPTVALNGKSVPETELHLDLMKLGEGPQGPSWTERTQRLLRTHGPFRLAWLETLIRIADWRASRKEQEAGHET
ncbi:MAG: CRISPR-associated endonuclease Cas3'' [Wenzhouxiangellaceae bacterium]